MFQGYRFRIYPNAAQREQIDRTIDCARWAYNKALEVRKSAYEARGENVSTYDTMAMVPGWKRERPWLAEADSCALREAVRDLGQAYDGFFRRCREGAKAPGYPRFRSRHDSYQSYRTNSSTVSVVDGRHIRLPKLGLVKARVSREVEGRVLSATVKRTPAGKYFCTICATDVPLPPAVPGNVETMGVDAGIKDIAVCSDGSRFANPRALARSERKLRREQRRLSRKRKGSSNYLRQKEKVARVNEKIANRRKDALHKATTSIVRESQAVAVEDLNVKGMLKNRKIAKAAADASMGELRRQLRYKAARHGRAYVEVDRWFPSSRLCSECGAVNASLELSERSWACPECGAVHDRDLNAARNIAAEGERMLKEGTAGRAGTSAQAETLAETLGKPSRPREARITGVVEARIPGRTPAGSAKPARVPRNRRKRAETRFGEPGARAQAGRAGHVGAAERGKEIPPAT